MNQPGSPALGKVPEVTLLFWIVKIAATTPGEAGGDAVSMSMHLGYLVGTAVFAIALLIAAGLQIKARAFDARQWRPPAPGTGCKWPNTPSLHRRHALSPAAWIRTVAATI